MCIRLQLYLYLWRPQTARFWNLCLDSENVASFFSYVNMRALTFGGLHFPIRESTAAAYRRCVKKSLKNTILKQSGLTVWIDWTSLQWVKQFSNEHFKVANQALSQRWGQWRPGPTATLFAPVVPSFIAITMSWRAAAQCKPAQWPHQKIFELPSRGNRWLRLIVKNSLSIYKRWRRWCCNDPEKILIHIRICSQTWILLRKLIGF